MTISRIQSLLSNNSTTTKNNNLKPLLPPSLAFAGNKLSSDSTSFSQLNKPKTITLSQLNFVGEGASAPKSLKLHSLTAPDKLSPVKNTQNYTTSVPPGSAVLNLPPRSSGSLTGSQFLAKTAGVDRMKREEMIFQEIKNGNVPDFARQMKELTITGTGKDGQIHTAKISVMPDYLAIGSDKDFVRIPMNPITAQKIADITGTVLPTSKIVDEVYKKAEAKLTPQPMPAGSRMMSSEYYQTHQNMVQSQMDSKGIPVGLLTAGHKKDVILSNMLDQKAGRVAIYGWHQPNGKPIQGTSTVHENTYADYSHGVRLLAGKMTVDGVQRNVADVMKDPNVSFLVSKEGPIITPRIKY